MRFLLLLVGLILLGIPAKAESTKSYMQAWAASQGGKCNVRLPDGSRVDVLTDKNAVDFVFAGRWQNAIGQSLSHAMSSGKRGGIVLIVLKEQEFKNLDSLRLMVSLFDLPIDIWTAGLPDNRRASTKPE